MWVDQPETARPTALPTQPTHATATPSVDGAESLSPSRSHRRSAQPSPLRESPHKQKPPAFDALLLLDMLEC